MIDSEHRIIGCHCSSNGVAVTLVEILNEREYYILEDWHQDKTSGLASIVDKCSEFFHKENTKSNRKAEIFINSLGSLELLLIEALQAYSVPVKIVSVEKEELFTLINSLIAEDRLSISSQISGLERELKLFDFSATHPNHRVQALLNAVGQSEFDRIAKPKHHYSIRNRIKTPGSICPTVFFQ